MGFFKLRMSNIGALLSSDPHLPFLPIQPPTDHSKEEATQAWGGLNQGEVGRLSRMTEAIKVAWSCLSSLRNAGNCFLRKMQGEFRQSTDFMHDQGGG